MVNPIESNSCAIPTPVKYVGAGLSLAGLIGFSTALYLGKLNRNVALLGAGVSSAVLITSIVIKGKTTTKTDEPKEEKVTLRFQDMNDVGDLDKLVAAIKSEENKDLQVLDLTELNPIEDYRKEGQLLVAIAEHPKLELVKFGAQQITLTRVPDWQAGLEALAEGRDADVPELLKTFLGRVDFVTLSTLPNDKLLPKLAKFENLKGIVLADKEDRKLLHKGARAAILGGTDLTEEQAAFLKLLPALDGGKEKGNRTMWNFNRVAWTSEKLGTLLDACPNLRHLDLANVTRPDQWTEELAGKVQTHLDRGCKVSSLWAEDLALAGKDDRDSARFKVAAEIATNMQPGGADWTKEAILEMLPLLNNLEHVHISSFKLELMTTPEVVAALKDKDLKSVSVDLKDGYAGDIKALEHLPVNRVTFDGAQTAPAGDVQWVAETLKPHTIKFSGNLPADVDEKAMTIDGKAFAHYDWVRSKNVLYLTLKGE